MPIPDSLGLCPYCRTRVALDAERCPVCVRPFLREEARRLAEEENAKDRKIKEPEQKQESWKYES
jgi:predicted amidophosphoribosyltransferase